MKTRKQRNKKKNKDLSRPNSVLKMKRGADLGGVDEEEVHDKPKDAPSTRHKKRIDAEREGTNGFEPEDNEVGFGPYPSIRREKIDLIKVN